MTAKLIFGPGIEAHNLDLWRNTMDQKLCGGEKRHGRRLKCREGGGGKLRILAKYRLSGVSKETAAQHMFTNPLR